MQKPGKAENRGILYAVMLTIAFFIILILIVGGIILFRTKGDFYSTLQGEMRRGLLLSALLFLIFSSVLYTPISFGISHYFLLSQKGMARFSSLFWFFRNPRLLLKAIALTILKKVFIYLEGLWLLLSAAVAEVGLFFGFLLVTGEDLFGVSGNPFRLAAEFMLRSPLLIYLTVLLWAGVLLGFLLIRLRYILCKYVVLCYPDVSPWQAVKAGRIAIKGHLWATVFFYLRYASLFILSILSFGSIPMLGRSAAKRNFSAYAADLAARGWRKYCLKRSGR